MPDLIDLWETPQSEKNFLLLGWRQWADAGSVSSGLPEYLIQQTGARQIGKILDGGFYMFQIPGTHDLLRPVVHYEEGLPVALEAPRNEIYYSGDDERGLLIFVGDEPHLNIESYIQSILTLAKSLNIKRLVGLGGVYGDVPFDKERIVSATYSLKSLKDEVLNLGVQLSDYKGGASIGSYLCKRAGEAEIEYVSFYAFVPTYDFSRLGEGGGAIRIENDFTAWIGIMRRINHMLDLNLNLSDLEGRSQQLVQAMQEKVDELDRKNPELGIREYLSQLTDNFEVTPFEPLDEFWEEQLRDLFDKLDPDEPAEDPGEP